MLTVFVSVIRLTSNFVSVCPYKSETLSLMLREHRPGLL